MEIDKNHDKNGWDVLDRMIQAILMKVMSGRWIATVVICFAFAYLASKGIIKPEDVVIITTMVISFYFTMRNKDNNNGNSGK